MADRAEIDLPPMSVPVPAVPVTRQGDGALGPMTRYSPLTNLFEPLQVPMTVVTNKSNTPSPRAHIGATMSADEESAEAVFGQQLQQQQQQQQQQQLEGVVLQAGISRGSSISSFDMSSLTERDHMDGGDDDDTGHFARRLSRRKVEAFERARKLALSLTEDETEESGWRRRAAAVFMVLAICVSFLIFLPLGLVPVETQEAVFFNSSFAKAMRSVEFLCAVYFLLGTCACLGLETFISIVMFHFYQKSLIRTSSQLAADARRRNVLTGVGVISATLIAAVMIPYIFVLSWIKGSAQSLIESRFVTATTWQYQTLETIAVGYVLANFDLSLPSGKKKTFDREIVLAWSLNFVARIIENFANLAYTSMVPATVLHVSAAVVYFIVAVCYSFLFLRDGWSTKTDKERYNWAACALVLAIIVLYMVAKYAKSNVIHLSDSNVATLMTRTFLLNMLIVPISFLLPARVMQLDHLFVRQTLSAISKNLSVEEAKDDQE